MALAKSTLKSLGMGLIDQRKDLSQQREDQTSSLRTEVDGVRKQCTETYNGAAEAAKLHISEAFRDDLLPLIEPLVTEHLKKVDDRVSKAISPGMVQKEARAAVTEAFQNDEILMLVRETTVSTMTEGEDSRISHARENAVTAITSQHNGAVEGLSDALKNHLSLLRNKCPDLETDAAKTLSDVTENARKAFEQQSTEIIERLKGSLDTN